MRRRSNGGIWLAAAVALLLGPHLGPALASTFPLDPAVARPSRPHRDGRVASPGLTFTNGAGCRPADDWRSTRLDPRVRTLLTQAAARYAVRVSCLHTGHSRHVRGTSRISNHAVWRAVDIDRVAGRPVSPGNPAAKRLALAIGQGEFGVQPSEVGSPWAWGGVWFSDAGHQGHLHVGFGGR